MPTWGRLLFFVPTISLRPSTPNFGPLKSFRTSFGRVKSIHLQFGIGVKPIQFPVTKVNRSGIPLLSMSRRYVGKATLTQPECFIDPEGSSYFQE